LRCEEENHREKRKLVGKKHHGIKWGKLEKKVIKS